VSRDGTLALLALLTLGGCDDDLVVTPETRAFIEGTEEDGQIGFVVETLSNTVHLFQLGAPDVTRDIPLGASSAVTATGLAIRGNLLAVPLGNAASVAVIDALTQRVDRFFLFESGNATGSAFVDDQTLLVANTLTSEVGRVTMSQESGQITELVDVAPSPTDIETAAGRALVVSSNLDENFLPIGDGVVTALDPTTLSVLGSVETGGENSQASAVGPDGLLYVVNTNDYVNPATLAIIDPATLERIDVVEDVGVGAGAITVDQDGLAYISGFFLGTVVFDTATRTFVRGPANPVCAPLAGGGCRGAFDAEADESGRVYQTFFGDSFNGLPPWVFVYESGSLALVDSVPAGGGPTAIRIRTF
jgi:hypothetical protein